MAPDSLFLFPLTTISTSGWNADEPGETMPYAELPTLSEEIYGVVVLVLVLVPVDEPAVSEVAWAAVAGSLVTVFVMIIGLYPGAETTPP